VAGAGAGGDALAGVARASIADAYSATGHAWEVGPGRIYNRLARELVASSPIPLGGRLVLDVGSGTGAASRAVVAAGGHPVAVDTSLVMLSAARSGSAVTGCAADALALPFRSCACGAVVAAFSFNHLDDPAAGLREAARVTQPGGAVLASTYARDDDHPVKAAVDDALTESGWERPSWYDAVKQAMDAWSTEDAATATAQAAGLGAAKVERRDVEFPDLTADDLIEWRLGMAHCAAFLQGLDSARRGAIATRARALLGADAAPLVRRVVFVTAIVPE
jgi:ubiquinone/menaquinone biosynthesis C-methylase UbiE